MLLRRGRYTSALRSPVPLPRSAQQTHARKTVHRPRERTRETISPWNDLRNNDQQNGKGLSPFPLVCSFLSCSRPVSTSPPARVCVSGAGWIVFFVGLLLKLSKFCFTSPLLSDTDSLFPIASAPLGLTIGGKETGFGIKIKQPQLRKTFTITHTIF